MVDAADTPVLAVLTRAPSSRGKTRLFASLGVPPDPSLLVALLLDTLDGVTVPGVRRVVAVTPVSACDAVRDIVGDVVGDVEVIAQPEGDLGERMRATMTALFARGAPAVTVIGSDLPHIPAVAVADACALVAKDPDALVLGPGDRWRLLPGCGAAGAGHLLGNHLGKQARARADRAGCRGGSIPRPSSGDAGGRGYRPGNLHGAARSGRAPRTAAWLDAYAARFGGSD